MNNMEMSFCFFFCILSRVSYVFIWCKLIQNAVWRFSNINSNTCRCKKLTLNRQNFSHVRCRQSLFCLFSRYMEDWYVCLTIHLSVCLLVHPYVCMSVYMSIICFVIHPHTSVIAGNPACWFEIAMSCQIC